MDKTEEKVTQEVYTHNLEETVDLISTLIEDYPIISLDSEFPGSCCKPIGTFTSQSNYLYQQVRANTTLMNIIQLGITLSDSNGNKPEISTFQFNFKFDLTKELGKIQSINLLKNSKIDFEKNLQEGIESRHFGDVMLTSNILFNPKLIWISFHGVYDFAYIMKTLMNQLPETLTDFDKNIKNIFRNFFDLKFLLRNSKFLKKGLQDIANEFYIERSGVMHQAGSDSLLTCDLYFELLKKNVIDIEKGKCKLFGLEDDCLF